MTRGGRKPQKRSVVKTAFWLVVAWCLVPLMLLTAAEWTLRAMDYGRSTKPFLMRDIDGHAYAGINMAFYEQFMPMWPDKITNEPYDVVIPVEKPPNTLRVGVLGASAAFGFLTPQFGFWRHLEVALRAKCPDMNVEVYCLAWNGMNSHVMRYMTHAARDLNFDLFVVYMGNNEVKGTLSLMYDMSRRYPTHLLVRGYAFLSDLRLMQAASRALGLVIGRAENLREWEASTGTWGVNDPRLERVYANYRENVEAICDTALEANAAVALCTVATNLRTWRPCGSRHRPDLGGEEQAQWESLYERGKAAEEAEDYAEAMKNYTEALKIDEQYADLSFRAATCLLELGEYEQAKARFLKAHEVDDALIAANSRTNGILEEVAADREGQPVCLVDTAARIEELSPHGIPGDEFFEDHVHLSFEGNWRLAGEVYETFARNQFPEGLCSDPVGGPVAPPLETSIAWLAATPEDLLQIVQGTICTCESSNPKRPTDYFREVEAELEAQMAEEDPMMAKLKVCRRAAKLNSADFIVRGRYAEILAGTGGLDEAEAEARALVEEFPYLWRSRALLAQILERNGKKDEALEVFGEQFDIFADLAETHYVWAEKLAARGRYAEAVPAYRKATSMKRANDLACYGLGMALTEIGKLDEAAAAFEAAIKADCHVTRAYERLGEILAQTLDPEAQVAYWKDLCGQHPDVAAANLFLGRALETARQPGEALDAYAKAVDLAPDYARAQVWYGLLLVETGAVEKAKPALERAAELGVALPDLSPKLVEALEKLGLEASAKRERDLCFQRSVPLSESEAASPAGEES